jgi:hypothetical protein
MGLEATEGDRASSSSGASATMLSSLSGDGNPLCWPMWTCLRGEDLVGEELFCGMLRFGEGERGDLTGDGDRTATGLVGAPSEGEGGAATLAVT